jgi:hypothetical protein
VAKILTKLEDPAYKSFIEKVRDVSASWLKKFDGIWYAAHREIGNLQTLKVSWYAPPNPVFFADSALREKRFAEYLLEWELSFKQFEKAIQAEVSRLLSSTDFKAQVAESRGREEIWSNAANRSALFLVNADFLVGLDSKNVQLQRLYIDLEKVHWSVISTDWRKVSILKLQGDLQSLLTAVENILEKMGKITGGDTSVIDAAKPKLAAGSASPATAKTGSTVEFCFVASDDKSVMRVVGNVYDLRTGEWVVGASNGRMIAGTEKAGTWCLDAVIPIGRADGKYELRALAYDSIQVQSELTVVGEVEITGGEEAPSEGSNQTPQVNEKIDPNSTGNTNEGNPKPTENSAPVETIEEKNPETKEEAAEVKPNLVEISDSRIGGIDPTPLPKFGIILVQIEIDSPSSTFWAREGRVSPTYIEFC